MGLLAFLARSAPGLVVVAAVASILAGLASTALITRINGVLSGGSIAGELGTFIVLCCGALALTVVSQTLLVRISAGTLKELRLKMSARILAAPFRQLEEIGPARLMAAMTTDVGAIASALSTLPSVLTSLTVIGACLVYMGWLSWQLLLALLAYFAVGLAVSILPVLAATRYTRQARDVQDRLFGHYRAMTDGAKEVRLHRGRREGLFTRGIEESAEAYRRHTVTGNTIFELSSAVGQTLLLAALGFALFVAPRFDGVTRDVSSGYALTLLFMATPMSYTFAMMRVLVGAGVSYQKVTRLGLSLTEEPRVDTSSPLTSWKRLELVDVVGKYRGLTPGEEFTVGPVSLAFEPSSVTFIVGGNGSGKSTLAKVLVGLYPPESGHLLLDGINVEETNRDWYRQHFSAVFADFFLFRDLRGLAGEDLGERAAEYLSLLEMAHKVEIVDGQLSTTELSSGQRKRLALLGAYLEDRPIYLFDEWAADQDPVFKDVFYTRLLPDLKRRGKCVVVISHDDRYFGFADRVLKMESGRVVADLHPEPASETRPLVTPSIAAKV